MIDNRWATFWIVVIIGFAVFLFTLRPWITLIGVVNEFWFFSFVIFLFAFITIWAYFIDVAIKEIQK